MNQKNLDIWKNQKEYYINVLYSEWYKFLVKLNNLITLETVKFYENKNILTMHLPITTNSISSPMGKGSDSMPIKIEIQGIETYLADSMQFLLEYGCRLVDKGCYYIMPSFRGEKADKTHLCQFYHSEVEIIGNLEDVIELAEEYIRHLASKILEQFSDDLVRTVGDIEHIQKLLDIKGNINRITFDKAEKILKENHKLNITDYIRYKDGYRIITRKGEQEMIKLYGGFVWITNYDCLSVPFYQKNDNKIKGTVKNADLLFGIGEVIGSGERHSDYRELEHSLEIHKVKQEDYSWYINIKKNFPLQTSGFGMGIERFLMWILKCDDIRNLQICLRFNGEKNYV